MATTTISQSRLSIVRSAAAFAASALLLYVICWLGTLIGVPVAHTWIKAVSFAPVDSIEALVVGSFWSILAGAAAGAIIAFFCNTFGVVQRR